MSKSRPMCGLEAEEEHGVESVHSAEPLGLSLVEGEGAGLSSQ